MRTALLDVTAWDFVLDVNGDLAMASDPYSMAQDAASAIRTFIGECYYNTTLGVPYFQTLFGKAPNINYMKQKFISQALLVPGVVSATVFITSVADRRVTGQVQITDANGVVTAAAF
jgi:hypothetical protein